ncbi:hypothetical protein I6F26_32840 [Ensifer sp. IC3342]|nr:hypothetical protein [Ensifer sp. BRP08]MCA1451222.1 hypothetical protein [Ensifer sp. IC3342]
MAKEKQTTSAQGKSLDAIKAELVRSLKGADVTDYLYSYSEEEAQTTSALTNKAVKDVVSLDKGASAVVLRYTRIEDKKSNTSKGYKSEIIKEGETLALVITDLNTDKVIQKKSFPTAGPACQPAGQFDSVNACIDEFNRSCTLRCPLQTEANRTCENQFAALTCCLNDGSIISVHLIIPPDNWRCRLRDVVPDVEVVVSPG